MNQNDPMIAVAAFLARYLSNLNHFQSLDSQADSFIHSILLSFLLLAFCVFLQVLFKEFSIINCML